MSRSIGLCPTSATTTRSSEWIPPRAWRTSVRLTAACCGCCTPIATLARLRLNRPWRSAACARSTMRGTFCAIWTGGVPMTHSGRRANEPRSPARLGLRAIRTAANVGLRRAADLRVGPPVPPALRHARVPLAPRRSDPRIPRQVAAPTGVPRAACAAMRRRPRPMMELRFALSQRICCARVRSS